MYRKKAKLDLFILIRFERHQFLTDSITLLWLLHPCYCRSFVFSVQSSTTKSDCTSHILLVGKNTFIFEKLNTSGVVVIEVQIHLHSHEEKQPSVHKRTQNVPPRIAVRINLNFTVLKHSKNIHVIRRRSKTRRGLSKRTWNSARCRCEKHPKQTALRMTCMFLLCFKTVKSKFILTAMGSSRTAAEIANLSFSGTLNVNYLPLKNRKQNEDLNNILIIDIESKPDTITESSTIGRDISSFFAGIRSTERFD